MGNKKKFQGLCLRTVKQFHESHILFRSVATSKRFTTLSVSLLHTKTGPGSFDDVTDTSRFSALSLQVFPTIDTISHQSDHHHFAVRFFLQKQW